MMVRLAAWLASIEGRKGAHIPWVLAGVALYLLHIVFYSGWQIEDAAISYAYARNLAMGDGLVAYPGGPWVEGFSNPSWTLVLAFTSLFVDPFFAGKLLGGLFGALTLPLAWMWALEHADEDADWPKFVPLLLAVTGPFVQWSVAGLENGFLNFLMAAGVVLLLREGASRQFAWSAIPLGLLSITRPEAPLYAGCIVACLGWAAFRKGGVRWVLTFVGLSGGLFFAWHAFSYWAFGWPLPNTYYAKEPNERAKWLNWRHRTWAYSRGWWLWSGTIVYLPALLRVRLTPRVSWGLVVAWAIVSIPGMKVVYKGMAWPQESSWVVGGRLSVYALVFIALWVATITGPKARVRVVSMGLVACAFFFAVYSGGDWMKGYRWMASATVPMSILLMESVAGIWQRWPRLQRVRPVWGLVPLAAAGIYQTVYVLTHTDTSPFDVHRRQLYHRFVAEQLQLERPHHMEVDMGGNMYWSGMELTDVAGLVDPAVAHHHYGNRFIDPFVRDERKPDIIHLHGGWVRKSKFMKRPWFKYTYFEVPGYTHSPTVMHNGTFVRKSRFVRRKWPHPPGLEARFGTRVLKGLHLPATHVAPGESLYVETGWTSKKPLEAFRTVLFLHGPSRTVTFELPPGHDWVPPRKWMAGDIHLGRHELRLPEDLPVGTYDVGMVVYEPGPEGRMIPSESDAAPVYARGEHRWPSMITIVSQEEARGLAEARMRDVREAAHQIDCDGADAAWAIAKRQFDGAEGWVEANTPIADVERAGCWARFAHADDRPGEAHEARPAARKIAWARRLARTDEVERLAGELADRWELEGNTAWDEGDKEGAWRGWRDALRADPTRSALLRRFEDLRADRLRRK